MRLMLRGHALLWEPLLIFGFVGILALIVLSGVLAGTEAFLQSQIKATALWLLLFAALSFGAGDLFSEDAADGTLDQDFVETGGSLIAPVVGCALVQALGLLLLSALFAGLWWVGVGRQVPVLALLGLTLPLLSLRLLASAAALEAARGFGIGALIFLALSSPLLFVAVADRPGLIWALGLIFAPSCLALTPLALSFSLRAR